LLGRESWPHGDLPVAGVQPHHGNLFICLDTDAGRPN
jgi:hypothetical protein